jgi:alpha-tubulin suppressor-like RCC1 family protein
MLRHCGWVLVCLSACALEVDGHEAAFEALELPPRGTAPYEGVIDVAAGDWHSCLITKCGGVKCWGRNAERQLDVPVSPSRTYTRVVAGRAHTCALATDRSIVCWGDDSYGQVSGIPFGAFILLDAATDHTCAVRTTGSVACWGRNTHGQTSAPFGLDFPNVIATGADFSGSASATPSLDAWGNGASGQTAVPSAAFEEEDDQVASMSFGAAHGCLIDDDGVMLCWGDNAYAQVAPATHAIEDLVPEPLVVSPGTFRFDGPWTHVAAGEWHTCAISGAVQARRGASSNAFCFGDGNAHKTEVPPDYAFARLSAGHEHTCGLTEDQTKEGGPPSRVVCWGENFQGQTSVPEQPLPVVASCGSVVVPRGL